MDHAEQVQRSANLFNLGDSSKDRLLDMAVTTLWLAIAAVVVALFFAYRFT
jgi:hypothetical protein